MRVTLDIFSGRPNPSWRLPPGQVPKLVERLRPETARAELTSGRLGFRGLYIEPEAEDGRMPVWLDARAAGAGFAGVRAEDPDFGDVARAVLEASRGVVDEALLQLAYQSIEPPDEVPQPARVPDESGLSPDVASMMADFPVDAERTFLTPYEPHFWNLPQIRPFNNCYNYATNFASNTVGQPGRVVGRMYAGFTCQEVLRAASADGLSEALDGYSRVVALAVWPGWDFHWWRLHAEGFWAHKLGLSTARNHDNSNLVIGYGRTPETCNRLPYTQFCGFFYAPVGMQVL